MKIKSFVFLIAGVFCGSIYAGPGEDIANKITTRYNKTVDNCGDANKPAYECTGVVLHGEGNDSADMPWAPSDDNSMSYSYFRKDVFAKIYSDYDYGIILTPQREITEGKFIPNYRCAFSTNGVTDNREDDGCGMWPGIPESASCQSQGLFTTEEWIEASRPSCGWDLKIRDPAGAFKAMNDGSLYLIQRPGMTTLNNEIVIESWGNEAVSNLPVEAIFYAERLFSSKIHNARNLLKAQESQLDYYSITGKWLPIIHMIEFHPGTESNKYQYSFSYIEGEQIVPPAGFKDKAKVVRKSK